MFSKLLVASAAFSSAEAAKIKLGLGGVREDCSYNLDRMTSDKGHNDFLKYSGKSKAYSDPEFPADESSLFWRDYLRDSEMPNSYMKKVTGWARPTELVKEGSPSLFGSKGVLPTGTNQGSLGDCWFLASCAAIAENAERIEKIFTNTEYDPAGIFEVTMYHMTKPVTIVVDDQLPIREGKDPKYTSFGVKTPVNTHMSKNGAWWQPILEKAYAKFNVNYAQLNGGIPGVAFRELTGMPVETYDITKQSADEVFKIVTEADKKKWNMAASCRNEYGNLVTGHAYSLLGTIKLKGGPQLMKVRNPWGSEDYTGEFSDKDSRWTDAWKKQANLVVADDGVFHIPLDKFKKAFTKYAVLMYQDWHTTHHEVTKAGKIFKFTFTSDVDQEIILTIDYQNKRQIPKGCPTDDVFYNLYIDNGKPIAVSTQTAYGSTRVQMEAGKAHSLEIYNWADASVTSNYILTAYGEAGEVTFADK